MSLPQINKTKNASIPMNNMIANLSTIYKFIYCRKKKYINELISITQRMHILPSKT